MERYVLKWKGMEARAALVLAIFHSLVIFFRALYYFSELVETIG
ncbi:MAG: hypothetical protein ACYCUV_04445 [Phycisphaerae bacterium]